MPLDQRFQDLAHQVPEELDWLLRFLVRHNVTSVLSFGVFQSGVELAIAERYALLKRPVVITGIDIAEQPIVPSVHAHIGEKFPNVVYNYIRADLNRLPDGLLIGKHDFVFVDGDHKYESAVHDYELALNYARRFIGFHDIVDSENHRNMNCNVAPLWRSLKAAGYPSHELCINADPVKGWAGIGIIEVEGR